MKNNFFFYGALFAIIVLRLFFLIDLPFGQIVKHHLEGLNDEPSHYNYVKYLIDHKAFPVQVHNYKEPGAFLRNDYVYYQSPLFYLAASPGYALFGDKGGLYWSRMISWISGIFSLFLIAALLKKMGFSKDIQRAAVLFIGFLPCHAYFCSLTSNDAMSWAVALIIAYLCLGTADRGRDYPDMTVRRSILLGVFLAMGFLVKVSLLLFYPLVGLAFLYAWRRTKDNSVLLKMMVAFGIAGLLISPWVLRNMSLYHSMTAIPLDVGPPVMSGSHHMIGKAVLGMLKGTIRFFWFPMQHIPPSPWQRPIGIVGTVFILFFLTLSVRYFLVKRKFRYNESFLIVLFLVNIVSYVKVNRTWGDWEARYLFPSLASIVFLIIIPLGEALASLRMNRLFTPVVILLGIWGYSYLLLTF